jgi:hypothetical protein
MKPPFERCPRSMRAVMNPVVAPRPAVCRNGGAMGGTTAKTTTT